MVVEELIFLLLRGAMLGDASKELQVLSNVDKSQLIRMDELIANHILCVELHKDVLTYI